MSKTVRGDATILLGHMEIGAQVNPISLKSTAAQEDGTNRASGGFSEMIPGLMTTAVELSGFWDADSVNSDPDSMLSGGASFPRLPRLLFGVTETRPIAVADLIHFSSLQEFDYTVGFTVGKLASFTVSGVGIEYWRGNVLDAAVLSASTAGAGQNLGATLAAQHVGVGGWVIATSGSPTLSVDIESAPANVWTGAQTVRATLTNLHSTPQWQLAKISGPITDTYWRAKPTFGGSGTITYRIALAIA